MAPQRSCDRHRLGGRHGVLLDGGRQNAAVVFFFQFNAAPQLGDGGTVESQWKALSDGRQGKWVFTRVCLVACIHASCALPSFYMLNYVCMCVSSVAISYLGSSLYVLSLFLSVLRRFLGVWLPTIPATVEGRVCRMVRRLPRGAESHAAVPQKGRNHHRYLLSGAPKVGLV